ncbi:MAG: hypothetical protein AAGF12_37240 [Myxococcota bacterium]
MRAHSARRNSLLLVLFAALGVACAKPPVATGPELGVGAAPVPFADFVWPEDPRVRSAGKVRALGVAVDGALDEQRATKLLQDHFAYVLSWLDENERESLDVATARLLERLGETGASSEAHAATRERLRAARHRQRDVLARYAAAGVFPRNETIGGKPVPFFVDDVDTACAVGHLMREDGWRAAVAEIRTTRNGIYVEDAEGGALYAWVSESGLTIEEAAVIQPGYNFLPTNLDVEAVAAPGGSFTQDGITISNLRRSETVFTPTAGTDLDALRSLSAAVGFGAARDALGVTFEGTTILRGAGDWGDTRAAMWNGWILNFQNVIPPEFNLSSEPYSPFLFWNPNGGLLWSAGSNQEFQTHAFEMSFEIASAAAGYAIGASHFEVQATDQSCFLTGQLCTAATWGTNLYYGVLVETVGGESLSSFTGFASRFGTSTPDERVALFDGHERVRVTVSAWTEIAEDARTLGELRGGPAALGGFRQEFGLVPIPEPGTAVLLGIGLVMLRCTSKANSRTACTRRA